VIIPINDLYLEGPIDMGHVTLRPIDRATLDSWIEEAVAGHENKRAVDVAIDRWRTEMQGKAAAESHLVAEPRRAVELSRRRSAEAVALLALFHPAMFIPEARSHCVLLGAQQIETATYVILREGRYESKQSHMLPPFPIHWKLSNVEIRQYRQMGLDHAAALLRTATPTDFQKALLEALLLFSRSALSRDFSERLLYIIVALETMLLRNRTEGIQQNLAERVAFLVTTDPKARQQVVADIKGAYHLRSEFVHHGATVEETETVKKIMYHTWNFLNLCLRNISAFKTRDDLFAYIDQLTRRSRNSGASFAHSSTSIVQPSSQGTGF
jgi:hypothetical protein